MRVRVRALAPLIAVEEVLKTSKFVGEARANLGHAAYLGPGSCRLRSGETETGGNGGATMTNTPSGVAWLKPPPTRGNSVPSFSSSLD